MRTEARARPHSHDRDRVCVSPCFCNATDYNTRLKRRGHVELTNISHIFPGPEGEGANSRCVVQQTQLYKSRGLFLLVNDCAADTKSPRVFASIGVCWESVYIPCVEAHLRRSVANPLCRSFTSPTRILLFISIVWLLCLISLFRSLWLCLFPSPSYSSTFSRRDASSPLHVSSIQDTHIVMMMQTVSCVNSPRN